MRIAILPFLERQHSRAAYRGRTLSSAIGGGGFRTSIIEACLWCSVIASESPVLRESVATAVSYCAIGDVEGWSRAIAEVIRERDGR